MPKARTIDSFYFIFAFLSTHSVVALLLVSENTTLIFLPLTNKFRSVCVCERAWWNLCDEKNSTLNSHSIWIQRWIDAKRIEKRKKKMKKMEIFIHCCCHTIMLRTIQRYAKANTKQNIIRVRLYEIVFSDRKKPSGGGREERRGKEEKKNCGGWKNPTL